ncbi:anti-sigma E factor RseA [Nocardiopsis tropica]
MEHPSGSFKRAFARRPGEFSSTEHLAFEAVVAFVDGELRMNAHLRAGTHIAQCPMCAAEVDAQRQVRNTLRESGEISVPNRLLGQLAQIPTECCGDQAGPAPFEGFPTFNPESSRRDERNKRGRRRNAR